MISERKKEKLKRLFSQKLGIIHKTPLNLDDIDLNFCVPREYHDTNCLSNIENLPYKRLALNLLSIKV